MNALQRAVQHVVHPHDRRWWLERVGRFPDHMADKLAGEYSEIWGQQGRRAANLFVLDTYEKANPRALRLASDDQDLIDYANAQAKRCREQVNRVGPERAPGAISSFIKSEGYRVPEGPDVTKAGQVARYTDPLWWRRAVRVKQGRDVEGVARGLGMVNKRAGIYSSDDTVKRRRQQKGRNRRMLEAMIAINDLGEEFTLQQLSDLSVSNPAIRRSELMVRMAGFEEIAKESGHVAEFYTLTCPSSFHAYHVHGERNKKYNGSTPRQAQAHLQSTWAKIRSYLHRRGVRWYGFRVAEPHHDGTPHWHLLLFFSPHWQGDKRRAAVPRVRAIMRRYALAVDGKEAGAKERRFTAKAIDWERGTATGYIAKYIAKNIDGYGLDADLYGVDINKAVERVDAWASTWGIRQFQQIGGPPVTVWRELRMFDSEEGGILGRAIGCADSGDFGGFVRAMGGPLVGRGDHPIRAARLQEINTETGELPLNKYGEPAAGRIVGVEVGNVIHVTRWNEWRIERGSEKDREIYSRGKQNCSNSPATNGSIHKGSDESFPEYGGKAGVALAVLGSDKPMAWGWRASNEGGGVGEEKTFVLSGATAPPWSSVNNCTGGNCERSGHSARAGEKGGGQSPGDDKGSGKTGAVGSWGSGRGGCRTS